MLSILCLILLILGEQDDLIIDGGPFFLQHGGGGGLGFTTGVRGTSHAKGFSRGLTRMTGENALNECLTK